MVLRFDKAAKEQTKRTEILLPSERTKHILRFLGPKIYDKKLHWDYTIRDMKDCKGDACPLCRAGARPTIAYYAKVMDKLNDNRVVWFRMSKPLFQQLLKLSQEDKAFKKFYSYKHGRDIIIIIKRSSGRGRYDYIIRPGEKSRINKKDIPNLPKP